MRPMLGIFRLSGFRVSRQGQLVAPQDRRRCPDRQGVVPTASELARLARFQSGNAYRDRELTRKLQTSKSLAKTALGNGRSGQGDDSLRRVSEVRVNIGLKTKRRNLMLSKRLGRALLAAMLLLAGSFTARAQNPITIGFGIALTGGLAPNGRAALFAMQI